MPVDLGAEYLSGLRTAASIAAERQRLAQERQHAEMEAQSRAAVESRLALESQARLQTEKAYHDAQLGLRQQALEQAAQVNAQKTRAAAQRMAAQHDFATGLATGKYKDEREALYHNPILATPAAMTAAEKQSLEPQRIDLARRNLSARERDLADRETREQRERERMQGVVGLDSSGQLSLKNVDATSPAGQAMIRQTGTNLPPEVRGALLGGSESPAPPAPPDDGKRVRVRHPKTGKTGFIPAANLPAALKAGFTEINPDNASQ